MTCRYFPRTQHVKILDRKVSCAYSVHQGRSSALCTGPAPKLYAPLKTHIKGLIGLKLYNRALYKLCAQANTQEKRTPSCPNGLQHCSVLFSSVQLLGHTGPLGLSTPLDQYPGTSADRELCVHYGNVCTCSVLFISGS